MPVKRKRPAKKREVYSLLQLIKGDISFASVLTKTGRPRVSLAVFDEDGSWQRFDLTRKQVAKLADWLNNWLNETQD